MVFFCVSIKNSELIIKFRSKYFILKICPAMLHSIRYQILSVVSAILIFNPVISAQESPLIHMCGHEIHMSQMETRYPGYKDQCDKVFGLAKQLGLKSRNNDIYRIPVVVHIVWNNEEENLHDSLIINQIEVLNQDFRLNNPDKNNIREIFKQRQSDAGIEFELIEIKRVQTAATFTPFLITLPDEVKQSAAGGSDASNTAFALNIWVCKIQEVPFLGAQILGYAYPPADLPHWPAGVSASSPELDGVVIDFRCFGRNNPLGSLLPAGLSISPQGRTTTHEVGHYLGLRHIWGDGSIFGGSSCSADDGVEDTPNQGRQSNNDCVTDQNTCDEEVNDELDMIENYMDYSDQACQNAFTKGQIEIMRGVLEGPRNGLLELNTSTSSLNNEFTINIYPNPVRNFLQIHYQGDFEITELKVYNQLGKEMLTLKSASFEQENITLALADWNPGLYILKATNKLNMQLSVKFIKI